MLIDTIRFAHLLEEHNLHDLSHFLAHTAFIISHKSESLETLAGVLWYLPVNSPIIVVTNCPPEEYEMLRLGLRARLASHRQLFVVHQKDEVLATLLRAHGVAHILDSSGHVRDGKGEGMYLGTLLAHLLRFPRWLIFYDADNLVPCALLEYTLAMGRLFMAAHTTYAYHASGTLHNIRICWAAKPGLRNGMLVEASAGRCTSVVSPIVSLLCQSWSGLSETITSPNAGEQGMTSTTAQTLRFASGFSVETFLLLDLLFKASPFHPTPMAALLQQYHSHSPHFHTKRDEEHIREMIAASLGSLLLFQEQLPLQVEQALLRTCEELELTLTPPLVYPALQELDLSGEEDLPDRYRLLEPVESPGRGSDSLLETSLS
ncbi:mannosyl-3-phosphoglycerate synthase [Thermogemmatispora onikobensis]|uniref:mannosyl-3-phosphoglycerate synthase n=1 Tax=Thermogemmatispora onikobensis TaxID=732234 RepID=UPI000852FD3E|nr:mannosyl-3-phosphoglycerate synthase [Thermogemmatispora onikobensis]